MLTTVSQQFKHWEILDAVSRIEQNDQHPLSADIKQLRNTVEHNVRDLSAPFQQKAILRAQQLAAATTIEQQQQDTSQKIQLARYLLSSSMMILGAIAVLNVFDNTTSQVNIFWLIFMLLGVNTLSMMLYLISLLQKNSTFFSLPTLIFKRILAWLNSSKNSPISPWNSFALNAKIGHWMLGRYLQGAWLAYLSGALLTLLVILFAKQIDFVWGTTLLNENFFIWLTQAMSAFQQSLGLPALSTEQVLSSRINASATTAITLPQAIENRQAWAYFLIVSIMLYGILPRLLLWLGCLAKQYQAQKHYQPDWHTPYFMQLRERLIPTTTTTIVDADTSNNQLHTTREPMTHYSSLSVEDLARQFPDNINAIAYEWSPKHPWPAHSTLLDLGKINNRHEQQSLIQQLTDQKLKTLAICVTSEQVADRGARRFFSDVQHALHASLQQPATLYLLIFDWIAHPQHQRRLAQWLAIAEQLNIATEQVLFVQQPTTSSKQSTSHGN